MANYCYNIMTVCGNDTEVLKFKKALCSAKEIFDYEQAINNFPTAWREKVIDTLLKKVEPYEELIHDIAVRFDKKWATKDEWNTFYQSINKDKIRFDFTTLLSAYTTQWDTFNKSRFIYKSFAELIFDTSFLREKVKNYGIYGCYYPPRGFNVTRDEWLRKKKKTISFFTPYYPLDVSVLSGAFPEITIELYFGTERSTLGGCIVRDRAASMMKIKEVGKFLAKPEKYYKRIYGDDLDTMQFIDMDATA